MKDLDHEHAPSGAEASGDGPADRRPARWAMVAVGVALLALIATAGFRSAGNLEAARGQEADLLTQIDQARLRIEALESRMSRLDEDPATLERLAREELGMVRPGDVVIVLPPEAPRKAPRDARPADPPPR